MPTNIDKALYTNQPQQNVLEDQGDGIGALTVEIVDPEDVKINGESVMPENETKEEEFNKNLAEDLDPQILAALVSQLDADIKEDINSRKDWEKTYEEGLELLGLKIEQRTQPWNGACGVFHPVMTEAVVRFQSEMITETFPAAGPVKYKVIGKSTKEKEEAGKRVAGDMNYELTEVMCDYRPEHERLLWALPIAGSAFKKVYFDPSLQRQVAMFVPADDIIVPYGASTLETCPRITHRMKKHKNDIRKLQVSGFYCDIDLGTPKKEQTNIEKGKDKLTGTTALNDPRYTLYEAHVDWDFEGEDKLASEEAKAGIAVPYVVTINTANNTILSIYRNWRMDDETKQRRLHFVHYGYIPGFGFYHYGLIHLIGGYTKSATSILRQLVDAGTLSNLPGGLKTRGLRIKGDDTPVKPGEWRDVDVPSGAIKENLMPLPYKEPSVVLAGLLDKVVEEARTFASMAQLKASDMSQDSPVGTTLAILERMLKVMSAVQSRIHFAMKQEFKLLKDLICENTSDSYDYEPEGDDEDEDDRGAKREDYDLVEIIPVSDPNASTMAQRIVQYQAAFQLAGTAPQIYDMTYLHAQMLDTLGLKNINKIIPSVDENMKPCDPMSENMSILMGKPTKVFLNQDHESHIKVHMNAAQDPMIQQIIGQSPNAQVIQAALAAHVTDHVAYAYRQKMAQMMGTPLPEPDETLDPQVEAMFSQALASASDKLLQRNQQQAAQQQAQQAAQDPVLALQQQETQIKAGELQRKVDKDKSDQALDLLKLFMNAKDGNEQRALQERIKGMDIGKELSQQTKQLQHQEKMKGVDVGAKMAQMHKDKQHQREDAMVQHMSEAMHKKSDQAHEMQKMDKEQEHEKQLVQQQAEAQQAQAEIQAQQQETKQKEKVSE